MQNVAQAYKQTQVGTVGQGEIVVMLYDGALRFLAQAREKIVAKDFAVKGVLISRVLDIVNELDSSLNMEAGGELSQNLHNLYFLCTTRLLQANMKLDLAMLDSVVDILTGLRGAFAQILSTPEAQQVSAQLGSRQAAKNSHMTARPLQACAPNIGPRNTVSSAYSQQAPCPKFGVPPAFPPAANPGASTHPPASAAINFQIQQSLAPAAPVAPAQAASVAATSVVAKPIPAPVEPAVPAQTVAPKPEAPAAGGFAGKRLAIYGKMQQTR